MGRHSATPRDRGPQFRRLSRNFVSVLLATMLTMLVVVTGIASYAAIKDREIPLPTMATDQSGNYVAIPGSSAHTDAITSPTEMGGDPVGGQRQCPVTGCSAPTCHAETGEPIPSR